MQKSEPRQVENDTGLMEALFRFPEDLLLGIDQNKRKDENGDNRNRLPEV